jgi:hypothetical protein
VSYGIWLLAENEATALFWSRMLNLGATFIPVFLLHWILSFLEFNKKRKKIIFFYYFLTFIAVALSFSNYYVTGVEPVRQFSYWPQIGWIYILFLIVCWTPIFLYSFFILIKEFKNRKTAKRQQILYILLGLIIGFLGGSTNFLLMMGIDILSPVGSIFVIAFPISFAYAVIVHRLMDIKLVMRRYSVFTFSIASILILTTIVRYFINLRYL